MASGPSVPSARPPRSRPVASARPGALLTAAAAVPLGAAVLYAAGALGWVPRLLLGAALIVLGTAIGRTAETVVGARIGARSSRVIGFALTIGGALMVGGALVSAVVDGGSGDDWAPLLLCLALGAAGVWIARSRPSIGGVVAALAAAVAWRVLLDALGIGVELDIVLTVLPAVGLTVVALWGGGPPALRAGVGTAAALMIVAGSGEFTGLSSVLSGLTDSSTQPVDPATGWLVAQVVGSKLALGALLATAFVRRDPVGGALAASALLSSAMPPDTVLRIAYGVIPAITVVVLIVALRSEGLRRTLTARVPAALRTAGWNVSPDVARGALAVALVVCLVNVWSADSRVFAAVAVALLLAVAILAGRTGGLTANVAASVALVGWVAIQPLIVLMAGDAWWGYGSTGTLDESAGLFDPSTTMAVNLAAITALGVALAAWTRAPAVAAAAAFAVVWSTSLALLTWTMSGDGGVTQTAMTLLVPPVVPLVLAAGLAVAGPARWVAHAQAVAAASAAIAAVALFALPTLVLSPTSGADMVAVSAGDRLVLVLVLVTLALGGTLLASSTARRGSAVAALGAVAAAFGTAVLAATVSVLLAAPLDGVDPLDPSIDVFVPLVPVLGFDWHGGLLRFADGAWPVLFGVLGLVLLGAAAWLESRLPVPADAPVASLRRD